MPQVPILQGPSVRSEALRGGEVVAPDTSTNQRAVGALTAQADKFVDRANHDAAWAAEAQIKTEFASFEADLRKQSQGRNAAGYADKVAAWWDEAEKATAGKLTRDQKAIISRSLAAVRGQTIAGSIGYQNAELDKSEAESFAASQQAEIQRGAASGDPAVAATAAELLRARNAQRAAQKGWTPEQLAEANTKLTTVLHVNLLQSMQQRDPAAALAYFQANKGEIDGTRHAEIERSLTTAAAGVDGMKAAVDIWGRLGPKADGQPIELDKLEAEARKLYPNDAERLKSTLAQLKETAAAFNTAEKERAAANTNAVMLAYSKGAGLGKLMAMPEFTALPGAEQAKIRQHVEDRAYAGLLRANAAAARDDAADAREQRRLAREGYGAYLTYSEPTVLAGMSEDQVRALLPALGNELTNHLMEKKRAMVKSPAGEAEAKIDKQDFDHVANVMGLKPYEKKTDEEKAMLGEVQFRVEQLIYSAQQAKGKALTREEKTQLMRLELARTVKVSGFFSNTDKPVIALTKDDLDDVIVPAADRAQIIAAMRAKGMAPTESNLRRLYLMNQSRAAGQLPFESAQ